MKPEIKAAISEATRDAIRFATLDEATDEATDDAIDVATHDATYFAIRGVTALATRGAIDDMCKNIKSSKLSRRENNGN